MDYLKGSQEEHLILSMDGKIPITKWYVDAAFTVHPDFRSNSGDLLKIGIASGAVISSSLKQKIDTRSSTESELIAVDDMISKICWTCNFLH